MATTDNVHDVDYLYRAGEEAYAEGDTPKALHYLDRVLEEDPKHAMAWMCKGNCLDRMSQFEDALKSYDMAIKLDPTNADALFDKAETMEKMGRYEEAKKIMDQASKMEMGD